MVFSYFFHAFERKGYKLKSKSKLYYMAALIFLSILVINFLSYPIGPSLNSIEQGLSKKAIYLGDTVILNVHKERFSTHVFFKVDSKYFGYARLTNGLFGRQRFTRISHSYSSLFFVNNEKKYGRDGFLIMGLNPENIISDLIVYSSEFTITIDVHKKNDFVLWFEGEPSYVKFRLHDINGVDITSSVEKQYLGIQPTGFANVHCGSAISIIAPGILLLFISLILVQHRPT